MATHSPQRAYTRDTRRLDVSDRQIVCVQAPGAQPWSWQSIAILIGGAALLISMARSGAVSNAANPDPAWQAPPVHIENSYNDSSVNVCIGFNPQGCR
jgi:hypothetical protein